MGWRRVTLLACLGFAVLAWRGAASGNCGPTYGADGIGIDKTGNIWVTHFEDVRVARLSPASGAFREYLPSLRANALVTTQAGRIRQGAFDYAQDTGFTGIALDEGRGTLWTVRFGSNRLVRFSKGDGRFAEIELPGQIIHSRGPLPLAPDGGLWLLVATPADEGLESASLVRVAASGEMTEEYGLPGGAFASPAVAIDGRGAPWIALTASGERRARLYRLDRGRWRQRRLPDVGRFITAMVFDRRGGLWLTAPDRNAVVRVAAGKPAYHRLPKADALPHQLFVDRRGRVWLTEWNAHRIARLSGSGAIREYSLPAEEESPLGLAFAPDGSVWFSTLFSYALFQLDPRSGAIRQFAIPPPANWFDEATAAASYCIVPSREATARRPDMGPLQASRHPRGHGDDAAAAMFEKNCNTQCHTWYRVERAAERRTDWGATVDRMIEINGAKAIGAVERKAIIRYLDANYAARRCETCGEGDTKPQ